MTIYNMKMYSMLWFVEFNSEFIDCKTFFIKWKYTITIENQFEIDTKNELSRFSNIQVFRPRFFEI